MSNDLFVAPKKYTDDDIARAIGNRLIKHLREMYPQIYAETYPSCRLSMRNHVRNDVNSLLRAMRGKAITQDMIVGWAIGDSDEAADTRGEDNE